MSSTPNRQTLRLKQNRLLENLAKNLEDTLECQSLQTKILSQRAEKHEKRKRTAILKAKGAEPIRALVADASDRVFDMAKDELGKINGTEFEVSKATSFDQVVSALNEGRFDVLLVDCGSFIDEEDETAKLIKMAKKNSHTPVIVYGPEDSYECDMMAMEAGAADYLTKDELTPKRLEKAIRYCLCNG